MVLECYFDGSNQADSLEYKVLTLACIAGVESQWSRCLEDWNKVLKENDADHLHVTNLLTFNEPFTRENGWSEEKRDRLLFGCVRVALNHFAHLHRTRLTVPGLLPHTTTIDLRDHNRARSESPEVPPDAREICVLEAINSCFRWSKNYSPGIDGYALIFDQNEPFRGYILDRCSAPKVRKEYPEYKKIDKDKIKDADMRCTPALQIADLLAWCVSHKDDERQFSWQADLLSRPWWAEKGTYEQLVKHRPGSLEKWRNFNLPKRKPHR